MKDWHAAYKERYKALKEKGVPFFPDVVFKDALVGCLIFAALLYLAWRFGAGLEDLADPTDTNYNPRPEWYFLFLFQALKFFPGSLEPVAAIGLPGAFFLFLALLPFLDTGPERHPLRRPFLTGAGLAGVVVVVGLGWAGYASPMTNPIEESDPHVRSGQRLYRDLKCAYCHRMNGQGGDVGPELTFAVADRSEAWLEKHFRNPSSLIPGSSMPRMNLLDDEIHDLAVYMMSIGLGTYSPEAPALFAANCSACHKLNGEGNEAGPDLTHIGAARDRSFIKRYVSDPAKLNPAATMPSFHGELTDVQIEDLARFLARQK